MQQYKVREEIKMDYQQAYEKWLNSPQVDEKTKQELRLLEQDLSLIHI